MFLSIHNEHMFQPLEAFVFTHGPWTLHISFNKNLFLSTAILDNELSLGILFNGTMEINISVVALFIFYQSTKNLR